MTTQVLLIRHGETAWNKSRRIQGQEDVPLSPEGEGQARRLGARLKTLRLDAAYSSDSLRSRRTAELALEGSDAPLAFSDRLRERHFGIWQGLTWEEIQAKFPAEFRLFNDDLAGYRIPQGESWNQMQERAFYFIQSLAQKHPGQTTAVFTHGGPCKAAVFAALGLAGKEWRFWVAGNTSIHRLVREDGGPWKLAGFNDTAHLDDFYMTSFNKWDEGAF